jgi:hypothetical protein
LYISNNLWTDLPIELGSLKYLKNFTLLNSMLPEKYQGMNSSNILLQIRREYDEMNVSKKGNLMFSFKPVNNIHFKFE